MSQKRKAPWSQPPTNNNHNNQYKKPRTKNGPRTTNDETHSRSHNHKAQNDSLSPSLPTIPPITPALEKAVFTHQGSTAPPNQTQTQTPQQELTYDRLEFLGDAYIEVMATRLIWSLYPSLPAGRMSQLRELLVKNETLYSFALQYAFDRRIKVQEFHRADPKRWLKIVADVFEAYVAAVVLSDPLHGFTAAEDWLVALWRTTLDSAGGSVKELTSMPQNLRAKEELARKVVARGIKLAYRDEAPMAQLKGGMQTYFIGVYLTGWGWEDRHLGSGTGLSKVAAGNEAALNALEDRPLMEEITGKRARVLDQLRAEKEGDGEGGRQREGDEKAQREPDRNRESEENVTSGD